jgi:PII-like signaling protein
MDTSEVTVVRIYCREGEGRLKELMHKLHDDYKVRGVTVFRGTAGYGDSGELHTSRLLDISLDLPQVIEFFDTPDKVSDILAEMDASLPAGHVLSWTAMVNSQT